MHGSGCSRTQLSRYCQTLIPRRLPAQQQINAGLLEVTTVLQRFLSESVAPAGQWLPTLCPAGQWLPTLRHACVSGTHTGMTEFISLLLQ